MADKNNKMFILDCIGKPIQKIYFKVCGIYLYFSYSNLGYLKIKNLSIFFFQDVIIKMETERF